MLWRQRKTQQEGEEEVRRGEEEEVRRGRQGRKADAKDPRHCADGGKVDDISCILKTQITPQQTQYTPQQTQNMPNGPQQTQDTPNTPQQTQNSA